MINGLFSEGMYSSHPIPRPLKGKPLEGKLTHPDGSGKAPTDWVAVYTRMNSGAITRVGFRGNPTQRDPPLLPPFKGG